jgi:hypothetical protein
MVPLSSERHLKPQGEEVIVFTNPAVLSYPLALDGHRGRPSIQAVLTSFEIENLMLLKEQ